MDASCHPYLRINDNTIQCGCSLRCLQRVPAYFWVNALRKLLCRTQRRVCKICCEPVAPRRRTSLWSNTCWWFSGIWPLPLAVVRPAEVFLRIKIDDQSLLRREIMIDKRIRFGAAEWGLPEWGRYIIVYVFVFFSASGLIDFILLLLLLLLVCLIEL